MPCKGAPRNVPDDIAVVGVNARSVSAIHVSTGVNAARFQVLPSIFFPVNLLSSLTRSKASAAVLISLKGN
jgi:hypothetical protein